MAESEQQKPLSLAEQWSLKVKEDKPDKSETGTEETAGIVESAIAPEEIVPEKATEVPVSNGSTPAAEETTEAPVQEETAVEEITKAPEQEDTAVEETTEAPEPEETTVEEDAEEKPEIKLETAPADFRFPTTNQTRHCFTRYIEYHRCIAAKGEDAPECEKFAKYYRSLCPSEWVERWNEQRENGTFPGPL